MWSQVQQLRLRMTGIAVLVVRSCGRMRDRVGRVAVVLVVSFIACGAGLAGAVSSGAAETATVPRVDVGHESAAVHRELAHQVALPGPHVDVQGGHGGAGAAPSPAGRLVPSLSTAYSSTWQPQRGPRITRIYPTPVNYQDASGVWHPIASQLVPSANGGYANRANRFALHVPSSLASPVSVQSGPRSVSFALQGAHGAPSVSGNTASFKNALQAADVAYTSTASGVTELVTLKGASAPRSLRFALATSPGLRLRRLADGTLRLVDGSGVVRFTIPASVAYRPGSAGKASRVLSSSLTRSGGGWVLSVDTNAPWLRQLLASGAVVVDPTVTVGAASGCSINQNAPTFNNCSGAQLYEGYQSPDQLRTLLRFDVSGIPTDSVILNAQLGLYAQSMTGTASKQVGVYRLTQSFTSGTTWNTYDGTHAWASAGGDFSSGQDAVINPSVGSAAGWTYWYPTKLVQEWVDGAGTDANPAGYANNGLIVKDVTEHSVNNEITYASQSATSNQPYLQVAYEPRGIGAQPQFKMLSTQLTDKLSLGVNVASGNLLLQNNDLNVAGTGLPYSSTRTWNGMNGEYGDYGQWWDSNDVRLTAYSDGSVTFSDPSGAWFPFIKQSNGAFITPAGIKAVLCAAGSPAPCPSTLPSGVTWELIYNSDQTTLQFNSSGSVKAKVDRYGNTQSFTYGTSGLDHINDTQNRQFNYTWTTYADGKKVVSGLQDVTGSRSVGFGYTFAHGYHELTSSTDANNNPTSYGYEPYGTLSSVTTPRGSQILIASDAQNRVTSITRVTDTVHNTGPQTTFTYYAFGAATGLGCTTSQKAVVVTDPDGVAGAAGHTTTYCSNVNDEVELTLDANGQKTTGTFDPLGNATSTTAAARGTGGTQGVQSSVYDSSGSNVNCTVSGTTSQQTTCPTGAMSSGYATNYSYDGTYIHQPSGITDPQQNPTSICYYSGGNACGGGGGSGYTGPAGALKRQTDALTNQNSLNYSYNTNGTIASSEDANGNRTTYGYDTAGNLTSITPPSGSGLGQETITNDSLSRPHVITQCVSGTACATTETATITYDNLDRITKIVTTGPDSSPTIQDSYDKDGNLYQRIDPAGTTTYTVDALNRITNEADPGSVSFSYAWDASSNMTCFTDSGGNTSYAYNGLNQLSDMYETDPSCGAKTSSLHTTFAYDNDNGLTKITYASGATLNYGLDPTTGRIMSVTTKNPSGTALRSQSYAFTSGTNDTSLIQKLTDTIGSTTNTTSYAYDQLNRLLSATKTGASPSYYSYALDGAGNRTSQTINTTASSGGTTTYNVLNSGNQLLCRMTTTAACSGSSSTEISGYSYDQAGNQLGITGFGDPNSTGFEYNNANQLNNLTPPGSGVRAMSYLGAGQDNLRAIGSTTQQNSQLGTTQVTNGSGTAYFARTPDGQLIDQRLPGGANYNPITDAQGSTTGLLNSTGSLAQTITYGGPYGENANATGSLAYSTTNDPFLFQGGYHFAGANNGTGNIPNLLYHYGQRYYDPTTGRWTQPDPLRQIGDPAQSNRYGFAGQDPVNQSDATGQVAAPCSSQGNCGRCGRGGAYPSNVRRGCRVTGGQIYPYLDAICCGGAAAGAIGELLRCTEELASSGSPQLARPSPPDAPCMT